MIWWWNLSNFQFIIFNFQKGAGYGFGAGLAPFWLGNKQFSIFKREQVVALVLDLLFFGWVIDSDCNQQTTSVCFKA